MKTKILLFSLVILAACSGHLLAKPTLGISAIYVEEFNDLINSDEEFGVMARIGFPIFKAHPKFNHNIEIETGYVKVSGRNYYSYAKRDYEIVPIFVNYRFETFFLEKFKIYAGGGMGLSYIGIGSSDDITSTGQVFIGFGYRFLENVTAIAGYRYWYVDEAEDSMDFTFSEFGGSDVWEIGISIAL